MFSPVLADQAATLPTISRQRPRHPYSIRDLKGGMLLDRVGFKCEIEGELLKCNYTVYSVEFVLILLALD